MPHKNESSFLHDKQKSYRIYHYIYIH